MQSSLGIAQLESWYEKRGWKVFDFQRSSWLHYMAGNHGLINAPTGSGKTYAALGGPIAAALEHSSAKGLKVLWISPLRALSKEIYLASTRMIEELDLDWTIGVRTGDTSSTERQRQYKSPPHLLITTPESIHVMLCSPKHRDLFSHLDGIIVDEWHDLVGSKRGVQVQLAISRLQTLSSSLKIWGISATIGNMDEAAHALFGHHYLQDDWKLVRADRKKEIVLETLIPPEIDILPWAGHLGLKLIDLIEPLLSTYQSVLLFTNTRGQCELWYHALLTAYPDLAGIMAMHHGSIGREVREWVEQQLYEGQLKLVCCTSSLDLGVDFRPVEAVIQVGSPKGIARLVQRAGRSGHQPGAVSKIYFLPTHALELIEAAAIRAAIDDGVLESQTPHVRSFDVLIQYLCTLAVGGGFVADETYTELLRTHCYETLSLGEWMWALEFLQYGGPGLSSYDEYQKVIYHDGVYRIRDRKTAQRHKLSIGTIVSEQSINVKYTSGKRLGTVEEFFISSLNLGDHFWFAGRCLELVSVKGPNALVKKSSRKKAKIPSWLGGRLPMSTPLASHMREQIFEGAKGEGKGPEMAAIKDLFSTQAERSHMPGKGELLIEYIRSDEGYHLFIYPFESRFVHEGLSAIIASRISAQLPISFSIAMNDYGFELLSDREIPLDLIRHELFDPRGIQDDILNSMNMTELARRRFRDIAKISGLLFTGWPGREKRERHLQSSSELLFEVFKEYDPDNWLYRQSYEELLQFQLEEERLRATLERIGSSEIILTEPQKFTPLCFPLVVDRLRETMSSEKLMDRIQRLQLV